MRWVLLETTGKGFISPVPSQSLNVDENKISPNILLIILILSAIFFISGLFHLLVRYLFKPSNTNTQDLDSVTAFQGQLQQLFHLHDAGVDQSFIDTLPIFLYKTIIGLKNPFDCAVCLCEFEAEDKLRLLPKCSHAFHLECIDTWLLSHSTCPLCRDILLPDFSSRQGCSVFILESGSESSREIPPEREPPIGANTSSRRSSITHFSFHGGEDEFGSSRNDVSHKTNQIGETMEAKLVPVKLGKFKNADSNAGGGEGSSDNSNVDGRRCFSTGSYAYVLDDSSLLQVAIKPPTKKPTGKRPYLPLMPGHRLAMSECDCHSSREDFKGFEAAKSTEFHLDGSGDGGGGGSTTAAAVGGSRTESFSFSKIWLRSKEKPSAMDSFSRAISFRLPLQRSTVNGMRPKYPGNVQEIGVAGLGSGRSELGLDVEVGSSMSLELNPPSFARRTLLRLGGKQNKVVHSSSALMFD